jgi:pilus assembly protein CpaC
MSRTLSPLLTALLLFLCLPGRVHAQSESAWTPQAQASDVEQERWIDVQAGQSIVWRASRPIARLLLSDPEVAEVKLLEEEQFQVRGVMVGTTDLWVWYRDDSTHPVEYQVSVHQDLSEMIRRIDAVVGDGEPPRVYPMSGRLVLDGPVADLQTLERLAAIARIYDPEFVNLMSVTGDHQVQLHVLFAEVSRTGMRELGVNAFFNGQDVTGGGYGPNRGEDINFVSADGIESSWPMPSSGAFQLLGAMALQDFTLAALLGALEESNLSKILAEPTLVAMSGQQAEFLAGGEVPIAITTYDRVLVEFKEYGIKLSFVPTVLAGDVIDLRVYTEVSEIDASVAISLGGLAIPGFLTRKGSSHLRMKSGTTFAMAGLLSESVRSRRAEIPGLGRIPIIGALFRYIKHETEETEIMIFVTPRLVRPMDPSEVPAPPTASEDNHPNDFDLFLLGLDHVPGSRIFEETGPVGMER